MPRLTRKGRKAGLPPGTLVYTGPDRADKVAISLLDYDEKHVLEKTVTLKEAVKYVRKPTSVTWLNVTGVHDPQVIEEFGKRFNLHPLVMEDILSTDQRPKMEEYDDTLYLVLRMLTLNEKKHRVESEQVSLILAKGWVLSFQETPGDVFDGVRDRIRKAKGRIRNRKADYLIYALLDAIVDGYFSILEHFGEEVELLEERLVKDANTKILHKINELKREALFLRRSVWPLRETLSALHRSGNRLIKRDTLPFIRDVYDHTIQVIDTVETLRDMVSGMLDIYLSSVSNKMNEVMKVLTIIATIFIPLTFLTGLYGMNFDNMPELHWHHGYFYVLGGMFLLFLGELWYFRKKGWI